MEPLELFHAIGDPASAEARRYVVDHDLYDVVRFRNVHYEEVQADLHSRGGRGAPALWDGKHLVEGPDAVVGALRAVVARRSGKIPAAE